VMRVVAVSETLECQPSQKVSCLACSCRIKYGQQMLAVPMKYTKVRYRHASDQDCIDALRQPSWKQSQSESADFDGDLEPSFEGMRWA